MSNTKTVEPITENDVQEVNEDLSIFKDNNGNTKYNVILWGKDEIAIHPKDNSYVASIVIEHVERMGFSLRSVYMSSSCGLLVTFTRQK